MTTVVVVEDGIVVSLEESSVDVAVASTEVAVGLVETSVAVGVEQTSVDVSLEQTSVDVTLEQTGVTVEVGGVSTPAVLSVDGMDGHVLLDYLAQAEADALYAVLAHNHDGDYDAAGAAAAAVSVHEGLPNPHPSYLTQAEADVLYSALAHTHAGVYDPAGTAAAAVAAHEGAADPHTGYLQQADADALYSGLGHDHAGVYDPAGTAASAVATHEGSGDPHSQYLTELEADGLYAALVHGHVATSVTYSNATSGLNAAQVQAAIDELAYLHEVASEPTGFPNRTDSTISKVDGTRTFSIAPVAGSFEYLLSGIVKTVSSQQDVVWPDTEGLHYFYFDSDGTGLKASTGFTATLITQHALVAVLYWDGTNNVSVYFADERHGITMDAMTHAHFHLTHGTQWIDGLALSGMTVDGNGSLDSHAQFAVVNGEIRDEDLLHVIEDGSPQELDPICYLPVFYRSGTSAWRKKTANTFPVIYSGEEGYGGTYLAYNLESGGSWSLADTGNNNYVLCHVFATNDSVHPVIAILGQASYGTIAAARAGANSEINGLYTNGMPFAEFTALATVIYKTAGSMSNVPLAAIVSTDDGSDYVDWRGQPVSPSGGVSTGDHGNLAGLGDDDHLQYHNDSRGDARYSQLGHDHDDDYYTEIESLTLFAVKGDADVISGGWTITGGPTFSRDGVQPPFTIAGLASGVLVTGLNADKVDGIEGAALVQTSRTLTAGAGLSGGGDLSADRSFAVDITGLTAEATVDSANDYFLMHDASAGALRKVLGSNLPGGGGVTDHGALTGLGDHDHTIYGPLASANTWTAKQNFDGDLELFNAEPTITLKEDYGAGISHQFLVRNGQFKLFVDSTYDDVYLSTPGNLDMGEVYVRKSSLWNKLFHASNDGAGSGLDADLLDGVQGTSYARSDTTDTISGLWSFSNASPIKFLSGIEFDNASDVIRWKNGSIYGNIAVGAAYIANSGTATIQIGGGGNDGIFAITANANDVQYCSGIFAANANTYIESLLATSATKLDYGTSNPATSGKLNIYLNDTNTLGINNLTGAALYVTILRVNY